ncbi:MAG: hypothetical protein ACLRRA_02260 [Acutalibacteraceae bacterium]
MKSNIEVISDCFQSKLVVPKEKWSSILNGIFTGIISPNTKTQMSNGMTQNIISVFNAQEQSKSVKFWK